MSENPYTEEEIVEEPCCRCGSPSMSQWDCCATGHDYLALCADCDIGLNRAALEYVGHKDIEKIMSDYENTVRRANDHDRLSLAVSKVLRDPKTSKSAKIADGLSLTQARKKLEQ